MATDNTSDTTWESDAYAGVIQREQPISDRLEAVQLSLEKLSDKIDTLSERLELVCNDEHVYGLVEEQDLRGLSPIEVKLAEMQEFIDDETEHIRVLIETLRL